MVHAFDPKAYEEAVVKPLRRWAGRELPDDLIARYAIDLDMTDQEVQRRLREVRSRWTKGLNSAGHVQKVYNAFRKADAVLQAEHGDRLNRIAWWHEYAASRVGARQDRIDDLTKALRAGFGDLGLIAPGQLDATVRAAYSSLAPDEVDEALATAGVRRSAPVELPKTSGLLDTLYRHLLDHLIDADQPGIVELVHEKAGGYRLLDEKSAPDLSATAIGEAVGREDKRADNQGARQALGILSSAAKDGVDMRKLAIFVLLDEVRRQHRQGVPTSALLRPLERTRWELAEARLGVFSILNETHSAPVGNLAAVRELLEQGRLGAARQMLTSIAGAEDAAAAGALVERQLAKVRELVDGARRALREGTEADAAQRFREAVALAKDDEDLRAELRRIPPEPVLAVTARVDGAFVRVSWRPAASHHEDIRYRVVRGDRRVPADPEDGTAVAADPGGNLCVDTKAPAGTRAGYAVFASVEGGPWSRPAGAEVDVVPGVGDVQLSFVDEAVEGRWTVHPDVVAVEVSRGDGTVIRTTGRTQFRDRAVAAGTEQVYTFVARYRLPDGSEVTSEPVRARASTAGLPQPVRALSLRAVAGAVSPRIELRWKQVADGEIVVHRATEPGPWEFGDLVPTTELAGFGKPVAGALASDEGWQTLTAEVPSGRFHYVPFTLGPDGAIRGHSEEFGVALPITGLRHQRFGDEIVLAWEWPEEMGTADVKWRTAAGAGHRSITQQQYRTDGGCRIACGPGAVTVRVRTKVFAGGGECSSPEVELEIGDRPPTVRYTVKMARKPLVGGGNLRVRLTADQELPRCTVVVVAAPGVVMPRSPADGRELVRAERTLRGEEEIELTAELPRLRKPYWVRCFVETEGVRVVDPSVGQLKVS